MKCKTNSLALKLLFSFLAVSFFLIGCGGGSSNNGNNSPSYVIKFYDENLDIDHTLAFSETGIVTLPSSTWYEANETSPVSNNYNLTASVNLYASPNVIEISGQTELNGIRNNLSGKYILMNDINLDETEAGFDSVEGWEPIGDYCTSFTGILNGNGYKITNLWIDRLYESDIGFFGYIRNAQIKNLGIEIAEGKEVKGSDTSIGGIAGYITESVISDSYSTGNINGGIVGGIAGCISYSNISNSYSIININGYDNVGGIAGCADYSNISNSYSIGNISGEYDVGGIVGRVYNNAIISDSYSAGNISGNEYVGGIAGYIQYANVSNSYSTVNINGDYYVGGIAGYGYESVIINSYTTGNVISDHHWTGGIVGFIEEGSIANSYSTGNVNGGEDSVGGIAGHSELSSITDSYSTGNIGGSHLYAGGIAGYVTGSNISNAYAAGNISGVEFVGGIAGGILSGSSITNNAAINHSVYGSVEVNRIIGYIEDSSNTISNNFALESMSGTFTDENSEAHHGTSKSETQLKTQSTYETGLGWSFGDNDTSPWQWKTGKNNNLPYLYWQEL